MASNVKFYRGSSVPSSMDTNGLYFTSTGRLYDGKTNKLIGEDLTTLNVGTNTSTCGTGHIAAGNACSAGCRGFYIKSINTASKYIYLTSTQPAYNVGVIFDTTARTETLSVPYALNDEFSIVIGDKYELCGKISAISGNRITYSVTSGRSFPSSNKTMAASEMELDDYSFYVPKKNTQGVAVLKLGCEAHGLESIAAGNYSYASGKGSLSFGDYAHTEGKGTLALYAAHAEGYKTIATGTASHAQGWETTASNYYSTALGYKTTASGSTSIAGGKNSTASQESAIAIGVGCQATSEYSVAVGYNAHARASASICIGKNSYAMGECSFAGGNSATANNIGAFAFGFGCSWYDEASNASDWYEVGGGSADIVAESYSAAFGRGNYAGTDAFVAGRGNSASSIYSAVFGYNNRDISDDNNGTFLTGAYNRVRGNAYYTSALGRGLHIDGATCHQGAVIVGAYNDPSEHEDTLFQVGRGRLNNRYNAFTVTNNKVHSNVPVNVEGTVDAKNFTHDGVPVGISYNNKHEIEFEYHPDDDYACTKIKFDMAGVPILAYKPGGSSEQLPVNTCSRTINTTYEMHNFSKNTTVEIFGENLLDHQYSESTDPEVTPELDIAHYVFKFTPRSYTITRLDTDPSKARTKTVSNNTAEFSIVRHACSYFANGSMPSCSSVYTCLDIDGVDLSLYMTEFKTIPEGYDIDSLYSAYFPISYSDNQGYMRDQGKYYNIHTSSVHYSCTGTQMLF